MDTHWPLADIGRPSTNTSCALTNAAWSWGVIGQPRGVPPVRGPPAPVPHTGKALLSLADNDWELVFPRMAVRMVLMEAAKGLPDITDEDELPWNTENGAVEKDGAPTQIENPRTPLEKRHSVASLQAIPAAYALCPLKQWPPR